MTGDAVDEDAAWRDGKRAGRAEAFSELLVLVNAELAAAEPYADTRGLMSLRTIVEDKIRTAQDGS